MELLVTVAIMAILAAVATPFLVDWMDGRRLQSGVSAVVNEFTLARSEAIKISSDKTVPISAASSWSVGGVSAQAACSGTCTIATTATVVTFTRRGILSPLTQVAITMQSGAGNKQVVVTVSPLGMVSACSPSTARLGGYVLCAS